MSVYSYKCPNCAANLIYNPENTKLKCDFCGSSFTKEEIDKYLLDNPDMINSYAEDEKINETYDKQDYEEIRLNGYNCENCGAEVVTDDTTLTTYCYYCHSPVVIVDRAMGNFKPDLLIPFKISKEEAQKKLLNWASKKRYVKKDFYSNSQMEKITGMYLPYWSLDIKYDTHIVGKGYKESASRLGDNRVIKTDIYQVDKKGEVEFKNLNETAYSKIDSSILNSIQPYNFDEIKSFDFFYLNGFFSEIYDIERDVAEKNIKNRLNTYKQNVIMNIFSMYSNYEVQKKEFNEIDKKYYYVLFPTWILTYKYNDKIYSYTMNGQTGNSFGELPIDKKLILRDSAFIGFIIFVLALLGGYFLW